MVAVEVQVAPTRAQPLNAYQSAGLGICGLLLRRLSTHVLLFVSYRRASPVGISTEKSSRTQGFGID